MGESTKKEKVIFIASSGGHLTQLLQLQSLFTKFEYLMITEKNEVTRCLKEKYNIKYLKYCSRKKIFSFPFLFFYNFIVSLIYLIRFNPKYIISTGAGSTYPLCLLGKIFRKKIIYIESFARMNNISLTGKLIYSFADLFVVQWKGLLDSYPRAKYFGSIY